MESLNFEKTSWVMSIFHEKNPNLSISINGRHNHALSSPAHNHIFHENSLAIARHGKFPIHKPREQELRHSDKGYRGQNRALEKVHCKITNHEKCGPCMSIYSNICFDHFRSVEPYMLCYLSTSTAVPVNMHMYHVKLDCHSRCISIWVAYSDQVL